ncbi:aminotransferase class V-fold PLP-dependent enzyme [Marinicrinis sediminis]|uniref:cysteine desulfurase n=1 Tax=Marinicrinis sediminis TaxID=1652465 RepID=A0ABW5RAW9_9BACL
MKRCGIGYAIVYIKELKTLIYLDHAASSWPKPPEVAKAVYDTLTNCGANPGRGSHQMAVQAGRICFEARKQIARLLHVRNPNDIAFTMNTTMALNLAILGVVEAGDHVICTQLEHNSVRRPLERLKREKNVTLTYVEADEKGMVHPSEVEKAIQPHTKLIVCNHSSNLLGSILPLEAIGEIAQKHGVLLLVDAAQTIGTIPIDVTALHIDMLAFPGHKGLLGPQGTGGLYIGPHVDLKPLLYGGTGSQSEAIDQPSVRPDRYESGTPNTPGLAGLAEGVKYVLKQGEETIHEMEWELTQMTIAELSALPQVEVLGPARGEPRTGIVSFNVKGADSSEIAYILDRHYEIAVRSGYHCTPLAHEAARTKEWGAVRASFGAFSTSHDAEQLIQAVKQLVKHY